MKIEQKQIAIRDLVAGYEDRDEAGVVGFGGLLDIRPPYQREFVYKDEQRDKVIETVRKGYPLNVMYWAAKGPGSISEPQFEVLDGQQRTLSICKYISGDFSIEAKYFHNLTLDQQNQILDYELTVYVCEGPESEKLDWFRTINIAGAKLTDQELLNAVYTGPWLADAKRRFSKNKCSAVLLAVDYVDGVAIRQEILEIALKWISLDKADEDKVAAYMAEHQKDPTAIELWNHFNSVINWVQATFPVTRKEMKFVNWGELYRVHKADKLDPKALEAQVEELMLDDEVTKKVGIYYYVLNRNERYLSLRAFTEKVKREAYTKQKGICANKRCPDAGRVFKLDEMEADHIDPWHSGGKSILANCQMLCKACNRRKGGI